MDKELLKDKIVGRAHRHALIKIVVFAAVTVFVVVVGSLFFYAWLTDNL